MAKQYKKLQKELNEGAMQDVAAFLKQTFHLKSGSERQNEIQWLKDLQDSQGGILYFEDGEQLDVDLETVEDVLGFLKMIGWSEQVVDQIFKNKKSFTIIRNMAQGASQLVSWDD